MEDIQFSSNETLIIGASGLGRELESFIETEDNNKKHHIIGFLDDDFNALLQYNILTHVLEEINFDNIKPNQKVLFAIANCEIKSKLYKEAFNKNVNISNYFHKSCIIGLRTIIDSGSIFFPNSIISCDVSIGKLVFVNCGSQIGHDTKIGDFSSIMANVDIGGGAKIGDGVFIGSNSVILPGVKIPDKTKIGAGSVVLKNIKESGTYFGNPATKIF